MDVRKNCCNLLFDYAPAGVAVLPAHDVAQLRQVGWSEIPVIPVTPLDIFLNAVQI